MDKINIKGVILTPLKKIRHPKGDIFHGMKKGDIGFSGFGEVYFSTILSGQKKGWNRHKKVTLNLIVPYGKVTFVIYDDKANDGSENKFIKVELTPKNYQRLTVRPGLWVAFRGDSTETSLILNIASSEHDPDEIEQLALDKIPYQWD